LICVYFQLWFAGVVDTNWSRDDDTSFSGVWTARLHVAIHAAPWTLCRGTVWGRLRGVQN